MSELQKLVDEVIADGVIDDEEVTTLKAAFYADGKIDQEEADAMFEINDAVSGADNGETYQQLFVEVLSDFVLKDEETPGVVDEREGDYLVDGIGRDGNIDDAEKALLLNLKEKATEIKSARLQALIYSIE